MFTLPTRLCRVGHVGLEPGNESSGNNGAADEDSDETPPGSPEGAGDESARGADAENDDSGSGTETIVIDGDQSHSDAGGSGRASVITVRSTDPSPNSSTIVIDDGDSDKLNDSTRSLSDVEAEERESKDPNYHENHCIVPKGQKSIARKKPENYFVFGKNNVSNAKDTVKLTVSEQKVARALVRETNEDKPVSHVKNSANITLTKHDFETLAEGQWLNSNVINVYMSLLADRNSTRGNLPTFWAFSTFFYTKFTREGYKSVKRWTKKCEQSLFDYDLVAVPINVKKSHWYCGFIDNENKRLELYDSLPYDDPRTTDDEFFA